MQNREGGFGLGLKGLFFQSEGMKGILAEDAVKFEEEGERLDNFIIHSPIFP